MERRRPAVKIVFDVRYYGHRTRRQAVVRQITALIKRERRTMPENFDGAFKPEPLSSQPSPAEASLPGRVSAGELASQARATSPRGGSPSARATPVDPSPSGPAGINEISNAPSMPAPAPMRSFTTGAAAPGQQRLEPVKSAAEAARGAMGAEGPSVGYQGGPWGDRRR
jgi:hypothetical protein